MSRPGRAPPQWRRRMGTAVLFLLLLDAIILVGTFGGARVYLAIVVSAVVLALIAAIWMRNTRLEKMERDEKA